MKTRLSVFYNLSIRSFCLCLTALRDYTPPCVLINGQAVVFFANTKNP